jgi:hypothetical protein
MKANSTSDGGDDQADHNDGMTAEFTVQTSGLSAEVARGGPHVNLIPREGGNTFSGRAYIGFTNGSMQSDNLGDLLSRGLRAPDAVDVLYYQNWQPGDRSSVTDCGSSAGMATTATTTSSATASIRTAGPAFMTSASGITPPD